MSSGQQNMNLIPGEVIPLIFYHIGTVNTKTNIEQ